MLSHPSPTPISLTPCSSTRSRSGASDLVWRLDRDKIFTAVEDGLAIDAIVEFLEQRSPEPIPQTVGTLLGDLKDGAARLREQGNSPHDRMRPTPRPPGYFLVDPRLKTLCLPAGDRNLVFRVADESKVRTQLRKLGYIMPSST